LSDSSSDDEDYDDRSQHSSASSTFDLKLQELKPIDLSESSSEDDEGPAPKKIRLNSVCLPVQHLRAQIQERAAISRQKEGARNRALMEQGRESNGK
jgi:hypothetical protein